MYSPLSALPLSVSSFDDFAQVEVFLFTLSLERNIFFTLQVAY